MADIEDYIQRLREKLGKLELPTGFDLNLATSKELSDYVLPLFIPLVAEFLAAKSEGETKVEDVSFDFLKPFVASESVQAEQAKVSENASESINFLAQAEQVYNFFNTTRPFNNILGVAKVMAYFVGMISAQMSGNTERARQKVNEETRPNILDIGSLTKMWFRRPDLAGKTKNILKKHGLTDEHIEDYLELSENVLDPGMIFKLRFRNEIDVTEAKRLLKMVGFPETEYENLKTVFTVYPNIQDIVRFAVREAYSDVQAEALGLDDERPGKFDEEAAKIGASESLSKNAWRAHWELVPIQFMRELLQRELIDLDQVRALLKAHDILPTFREPIIKAMYRPYTRVDVRRMYQDEVLDDTEIIKAYKEAGSNQHNAEKLAEWTIKRYHAERKELTKSAILQLYKHKEFTLEETIEELRNIGYKEDVAQYMLLEFNLKESEKTLAKHRGYVKKAFVNGFYTYEFAFQKLVDLGYNSEYAVEVMNDWTIDFDLKLKQLSVEQIEKLFKAGIMVPSAAQEYLHGQGYTQTDRNFLLKLWESEKK